MRPFFSLFCTLLLSSAFCQQGWQELKSSGFNSYTTSTINAMANSGDVIYASIGNGVFKWSGGNTWEELKSGDQGLQADSYIYSITTDVTGNVYAAGWFTNNLGKCYVARWNGAEWSELGNLNASGPIHSITADADGNLYAAGSFINGNAKRYVAKWNGSTWSELGTGAASLNAEGIIYTVVCDAAGNVYAGISYLDPVNFTWDSYVARWNGTTWSRLGTGASSLDAKGNIYSLAIDPNGNILAAGQISSGPHQFYVAKWDGNNWSELGTGVNALGANGWIKKIVVQPNGDVLVSGHFINAQNKYYVARWNGSSWAEIGNGIGGLNANGVIHAMVAAGNDKIFAAGEFTNENGFKYVTHWVAQTGSWTETGISGLGELFAYDDINTVIAGSSDTVYAAGSFVNANGKRFVARWDGITWKPLGSKEFDGPIAALARDKNGHVYAVGSFTFTSSAHVAKWNGTDWLDLDNSEGFLNASGITSIVIDKDNNVYVAGHFKNSANKYFVAKWDGQSWSELGAGSNPLQGTEPISALATDKEGNVYAGAYNSGNFEYYVAKWNGSVWSALGSGTYSGILSNEPIATIEADPAGNIYIGADHLINSSFVSTVMKWDGSDWNFLGDINTFNGIQSIKSDNDGNIYVAASFADPACQCNSDKVGYWDGVNWTVVGTGSGALNTNNYLLSLATDSSGNLYTAGLFTNSNNRKYVARFSIAPLPLPEVLDVNGKCQTGATAYGRLANPPSAATIRIMQDGQALNYNAADSSFLYFTEGNNNPGLRTVQVRYKRALDSLQRDTGYLVKISLMPSVTISTPSTAAVGSQVNVNATVNNGGTGYSIQWSNNGVLFATTQSNNVQYSKLGGRDSITAKMIPAAGGCYLADTAYSNYQIVNVATSIVDPISGKSITFGPNPVSGKLYFIGLSYNRHYSVHIHDVTGRKVLETKMDHAHNSIELSGLKTGVYFTRIIDRGSNIALDGTIRFVKE